MTLPLNDVCLLGIVGECLGGGQRLRRGNDKEQYSPHGNCMDFPPALQLTVGEMLFVCVDPKCGKRAKDYNFPESLGCTYKSQAKITVILTSEQHISGKALESFCLTSSYCFCFCV